MLPDGSRPADVELFGFIWTGADPEEIQMAELETYIPLSQAAVQFGLAERALRRMVENGIIRAVKLPDGEIAVSQGETGEVVSREERAEQIAEELRAKYEHLRGRRITVSDAERKYGVPNPTLSRWAKRGIIATLGHGRRRARFLDEADVAYAASVYQTRKTKGQTSGARIFDDEGYPYVLKHPELAQKRREVKTTEG